MDRDKDIRPFTRGAVDLMPIEKPKPVEYCFEYCTDIAIGISRPYSTMLVVVRAAKVFQKKHKCSTCVTISK